MEEEEKKKLDIKTEKTEDEADTKGGTWKKKKHNAPFCRESSHFVNHQFFFLVEKNCEKR